MKKYLFMLLAAVAMVCTTAVFTSCGSDDDNNDSNPDVVGTWVGTQDILGVPTNITLTFATDGRFTQKNVAVDGSAEDESYDGTYTWTNTMLVLSYSDGTTTGIMRSDIHDTYFMEGAVKFTKQ